VEKSRLEKLVADQAFDMLILKEAARPNGRTTSVAAGRWNPSGGAWGKPPRRSRTGWRGRVYARSPSRRRAPGRTAPWRVFNGRLRDELLDREVFEARVVLDQWRMDDHHRRPHGGLEWLTPAAFIAGLDDMASGVVAAASRGVSEGATQPRPQAHHADWSLTGCGQTACRTSRMPAGNAVPVKSGSLRVAKGHRWTLATGC